MANARTFEKRLSSREKLHDTRNRVPSDARRCVIARSPAASAGADLISPRAEPTRISFITGHIRTVDFGAILAAANSASAERTRIFHITSHIRRLNAKATRSLANRLRPASQHSPACRSTCRSPWSGIRYFICDTIPLRRMPHQNPGVQSSTLERAK